MKNSPLQDIFLLSTSHSLPLRQPLKSSHFTLPAFHIPLANTDIIVMIYLLYEFQFIHSRFTPCGRQLSSCQTIAYAVAFHCLVLALDWASVRLLYAPNTLCLERLMGTTCPSCTLESIQHVPKITGRLKPVMVSLTACVRMQVL